jgi:ABC-type transport system involved in multi-copper enzyme maturation permease subunit
VFAGPIFSREALTSPRQVRHFLIRVGYVAAFMVLMYTASQAAFGWQQAIGIGEYARFGSLLFKIFSYVQLSLLLFFALLFSASSVAQEKDRGTLVLLLLTDLRERELVFGKLFASLLIVGVTWAASIPVFLLIYLLGGVSLDQIAWSLALSGVTILAAGSWGSLVAYWREKTFQTLAISVLGAVFFIGLVWVASGYVPGPVAEWIGALNPYQTLAELLNPFVGMTGTGVAHVSALKSVIMLVSLSAVLNIVTTLSLRHWNTLRYSKPREEKEAVSGESRVKTRQIWSNPVLWREICTRAYGRKTLAIKLAYLVLAGFAFYFLVGLAAESDQMMGIVQPSTFCFVGLSILSLLLINAQAVTAITSEKDSKTLVLLLATDLTAQEFVYGKIGGILYNTKELILVPLLMLIYFAVSYSVGLENLIYLSLGFLMLVAFATTLGLHAGLGFENSRSAIGNSLGTMFFLFVGIFIFIVLLLEARSSFFIQFQSFIIFMGVGAIGLYASLTYNHPSTALTVSAGLLPFLTFYALTCYLLGENLSVFLAIFIAYGFTTLAMLIPTVSEFDAALGRTTIDK